MKVKLAQAIAASNRCATRWYQSLPLPTRRPRAPDDQWIRSSPRRGCYAIAARRRACGLSPCLARFPQRDEVGMDLAGVRVLFAERVTEPCMSRLQQGLGLVEPALPCQRRAHHAPGLGHPPVIFG